VRCTPREHRGFPFHRDNWTFSGIFGYAWTVLWADWLAIIGATWAGLVPYYLLVGAPGLLVALRYPKQLGSLRVQLGMQALGLVTRSVGGPLVLGLSSYWATCLRGEQARIGQVFGQLHRARAYLALALVESALTAPAALLMPHATPPKLGFGTLAAGLWGLSVQLIIGLGAVELVVGESRGGLRALQIALQNLRRRPFAILGCAYAGIALMSVSIACCGLPFIVFGPYTGLTFTAVYLAARTPPRRESVP
jgi:hypothetical protein